MLFAPASAGFSKFGAVTKPSAPVVALIVNNAASTPPAIEKPRVWPASGSVAVTVVTAVVFSATEAEAVAPPPFEVIVGGSFWLVTVTAISGDQGWVASSIGSLARNWLFDCTLGPDTICADVRPKN